ncbi:MAG: tetratricopeptide repeat protein, partial [Deltaproteobacteria bacterium]|nr:tetratricopeptide repeat protein [Deltaproteobacteria bacterium]
MIKKNSMKGFFLFILIATLWGCITISSESYKGSMRFDTILSQSSIDATARIQASHTLAPEVVTIWKNFLNTDGTIANWQKALAELETEDMVKSRLFARIASKEATDYDFLIKIDSMESKPSEHMLKVTMQTIDPRRNETLTTYSRESGLGTSMMSFSSNLKESLKHMLADMRAKLLVDYNEGRLRATAVAKKTSKTTIQYLEQASAAQKEGNYAAALSALRSAIRSNPGYPGSHRQASEFLLFLCDPDGSLRVAEESLKENPDDRGLRDVIGFAYNQKGDAAKARESLGGVGFVGIVLEIKEGKVNVKSLYANEAAQKAGLRDNDTIIEVAGTPINNIAQTVSLLRQTEPGKTIGVKIQRGQETMEKTVTVGSLLDQKRETYALACNAQRLNREGIALAKEQQQAAALAKFEEAAKTTPNLIPRADYNAALILEQTGSPNSLAHYLAAMKGFLLLSDEEEVFTKVLSIAQRSNIPVPESADRKYRIGILRAQQKRYKEAIQEFEAALSEAPWLVDAYYNLGLVYDFSGDYQNALRSLKIFMKLAPNAPNIGAVKTKMVEIVLAKKTGDGLPLPVRAEDTPSAPNIKPEPIPQNIQRSGYTLEYETMVSSLTKGAFDSAFTQADTL